MALETYCNCLQKRISVWNSLLFSFLFGLGSQEKPSFWSLANILLQLSFGLSNSEKVERKTNHKFSYNIMLASYQKHLESYNCIFWNFPLKAINNGLNRFLCRRSNAKEPLQKDMEEVSNMIYHLAIFNIASWTLLMRKSNLTFNKAVQNSTKDLRTFNSWYFRLASANTRD